MKYNKSFSTFLFTLLLFVSFQSSAGLNDATWYVSVDIDRIESHEIYKIFERNRDKSSDQDKGRFEKIPKEISYISLYGNAKGAEDATAVIQGDFSQFSINEYVLNFLYTQDDVSKLIKESSLNYKNHEINVLEVDEEEGREGKKIKEVYFSQINNGLSVISFQLDEVKNWLDNRYDDRDLSKGSLFSVVVDVQSALAHMGMNIDKKNHMMQSEIFQKVTQVSASVSDVNSDILLVVSLSTSDEATSTQIEQVINGLVAMNNLSGANNENEMHATLMQNLKIERMGNDILMSTYASIDEIKKLDMDKLKNRDKKVKGKIKVEL